MRDDDDGSSRVPHRVDSPHDGFFADGIEVRRGFVEDDDLGVGGQGAREG